MLTGRCTGLTQETFLGAYQALARWRPEARFTTWLFRIARNQAFDWLRRRKRVEFVALGDEQDLGFADPAPTPDAALETAQRLRGLERALGWLSTEHREILLLREIEEMSYEDIADVLDISPLLHRPADIAAQPPHLNLQDYLELTVEQRTQWQQLEPAFLHELAANWQDIRQHRGALVRHIFAAAPDRTAIDAEQAAIAGLQGAQQQRVIAQLLAERNVLDEQQRKRLMDLLLSRYSQETTEEEQLHRD